MKAFLRKAMANEKGEPVVVFVVIFLMFVFLPVAVFFSEYSYEMAVKQKVESAIVVSGFSALYRATPATKFSEVDKEVIHDLFIDYLKRNLKLNDDMTSKSGIFEGPVQIDEFAVYGADELPAVCPRNNEIYVPAIHVVVRAKLKRVIFTKYSKYTNIVIHKDVDVFEKGGY